MNRYEHIISEVEASRGGPSTAAFFDFDGTLIAGFSVLSFLQRRLLSGRMAPREAKEQLAAIANWGLKQIDFPAVMQKTAASLSGVSDKAFRELANEVFIKDISVAIYPESRALVDAHLAKGHTVVLLSSATQYQVELAAEELGIRHVLCTQLEVEDGVLTGNIEPPICYGEGKRDAALKFGAKHKINLKKSFFYSDGAEDIPLLEEVGHPRPLNPDEKLKARSEREHWPTRSFNSRGTPSLEDLARTGLVYGSLVGSLLAGLPAWLLNGSKRDMKNLAMSTYGDFASAFAGLDVNVDGEEHLWSDRPAVFIFNHQSATDTIIISRLLRQDFTGVAKKEIKSHPVAGPVMRAMDVVFIDRGDNKKAIKALKPAVESIRGGTSFAIAPEGQRSLGYKLGKFKKGAFHIAMQAGVPIVPIIIQNSADSLPKSGFLIRPAKIDVTVLPPVRTDEWKVETIDQHIASVRQMFLEVLGQSGIEDVKLRRVK